MNDRFKFRIWHNPLKTMHYNDFIVTATGYMAKIYQQDDYIMKFNQEDLEFDKQCILMQCTGLKDKKGKLIYEGDILKINETSRLVVVRFKGISFELFAKPTNLVGYHNDKYIPEDCEIVGNIYESPELLRR